MTNLIGISGKINSGKDTVGMIIQYLIWKSSIESGEPGVLNYTLEDFQRIGNSLSGWEIKKFADKVKDIVCLLIGCTKEQLEDREFKEQELGEEWWLYREKTSGVLYDYEPKNFLSSGEYELIKTTPRLLLQLLGTDCGRNIIHPNIWVNALFSDYKKYNIVKEPFDGSRTKFTEVGTVYPKWIITDLRFPNELKAIKDRAGITIRVNRKYFTKKVEGQTYWFRGEDFLASSGHEEHESETALDDAEFDYVIENDGSIEDLIEKVEVILLELKLI